MNIDTTEQTQTTEPAIGYIPGYAQVFSHRFPYRWTLKDAESVRMSEEYRAIKMQYTKAFRGLQDIHTLGQRLFKKEIRKEHEDKRKQKCSA